jgi:hypothetical protein
VNTSFGRRRELAEYLVNHGAPNLIERLSGQALKPWAARGLGKLGMQVAIELASFGLGAHSAGLGGGGLAALATLPMMSPRLMGEGAYYTGRLSRPIGQAALPAYQLGRLFVTDAQNRQYYATPENYDPASLFAPGRARGGFAPWQDRGFAYQMHRHGLLRSDVPGRTDKLNINVPSGAYVIPADIVAGEGQGNAYSGCRWRIHCASACGAHNRSRRSKARS